MTGPELKQARAQLELTQAELAQRLHVTGNTIARYEMPGNNGRYPIPHWVAQTVRLWIAMRQSD